MVICDKTWQLKCASRKKIDAVFGISDYIGTLLLKNSQCSLYYVLDRIRCRTQKEKHKTSDHSLPYQGQCKYAHNFSNYVLFQHEKIKLKTDFRYSMILPPIDFLSWRKKKAVWWTVNISIVLKKDFKSKVVMVLQCYFQSGSNALKINLFECKCALILDESILRSNRTYSLWESVSCINFWKLNYWLLYLKICEK